MQFAASILALAAVAVANMADVQSPPQCAITCFMSNMGSSSCSSNMDYKCLCSDQNYITVMESCVQTDCSRNEADTAKQWAHSMCKEQGVDINMDVNMKNMKHMKHMRNLKDMKNLKDMHNLKDMNNNMKDTNSNLKDTNSNLKDTNSNLKDTNSNLKDTSNLNGMNNNLKDMDNNMKNMDNDMHDLHM